MKTTDRGYFTVFTRQYLQKYYILKKKQQKNCCRSNYYQDGKKICKKSNFISEI